MYIVKAVIPKILLAATLFSLSALPVQAQTSPDWTPVFKSFENACQYDKTLSRFMENLYQHSSKTRLPQARKVVLPQAYQAVTGKIQRQDKGDHAIFVVPVKQGSYYGLPVKEIQVGTGLENGISFSIIILDTPFATAQKSLSKVKYKSNYDEDIGVEFGAQIEPAQHGKNTAIICNTSI